MVRRPKTYLVRSGRERVRLDKETLKARNLALVLEYQTATPAQKGKLLKEYIDLNWAFITYFPRFHGDFREEIINTFVCMIPEYFMRFKANRKTDINSYLAMYAKKNAVRDFLMLLPTVQHCRFYKDENGKKCVEKAMVSSLDALGTSSSGSDSEELDKLDWVLGQSVFKDFLNSDRDAAEEFLDGAHSYAHSFNGVAAQVVRDFENGLKWREVREKNDISCDKFITLVSAIRAQLQRLLKNGGKNVRFVNRAERTARDAAGPEKRGPKRIGRPVFGHREVPRGAREEIQGDNRGFETAFGGIEDEENQSTFFMESDGPDTWSEGEGT